MPLKNSLSPCNSRAIIRQISLLFQVSNIPRMQSRITERPARPRRFKRSKRQSVCCSIRRNSSDYCWNATEHSFDVPSNECNESRSRAGKGHQTTGHAELALTRHSRINISIEDEFESMKRRNGRCRDKIFTFFHFAKLIRKRRKNILL